MAKPRAADLFGEVAGVKAKIEDLLLDLLCHVVRHLTGPLNLRLMRVNLALHKVAHGGDDHLLLVGQPKIHDASPCCIAKRSTAFKTPGKGGHDRRVSNDTCNRN